mmetsp:Transcript_5802/g.9217  ORF Transcript_5802/g.9217 Transcript_5802/m.9217 type:complete len:229 (-) Transcript_5802:12-698(-)
MIILASTPKARRYSGLVLARVSEAGELEPLFDVQERVRKVCCHIPLFGVTALDPMINIMLRSIDERQRAIAAQALSCWCVVQEYAIEIWEKGSELIIDLLLVDHEVNPEGMWYAVNILVGIVQYREMREGVATLEFLHDAHIRSTWTALRHVIRGGDDDTVIEAAVLMQTMSTFGGLEQLMDVLVHEDGGPVALKACASVVQPLCAKKKTRMRSLLSCPLLQYCLARH